MAEWIGIKRLTLGHKKNGVVTLHDDQTGDYLATAQTPSHPPVHHGSETAVTLATKSRRSRRRLTDVIPRDWHMSHDRRVTACHTTMTGVTAADRSQWTVKPVRCVVTLRREFRKARRPWRCPKHGQLFCRFIKGVATARTRSFCHNIPKWCNDHGCNGFMLFNLSFSMRERLKII